SSTWSGGRPRRRALVRISESCSRTRAWPVNSVSRLGRSALSITRSSASASGDTISSPWCPRRAASSASSARRRVSSPVIALLLAQLAQGGPQHRGHVYRVAVGAADHALVLQRRDGQIGVPGRPAQVDQAGLHLVAPGGGPRRRTAGQPRAIVAR